MSALIRRKDDRSKRVEREFGRRLYATDLPYEEAMNQLTQKHLDTVKLIKQSEFEKPYLEDDYVAMEYAYNPPDWPGWPGGPPVNPGGTVVPDCKVGVEASGSLDSWRECDPEDDCSAWIFTCAHKLISITCGYCTIARITPLEGDRLEVIICSKEDKLDVQYQTTEDPSKPPEWKKFEEERECCVETAISIGYTSQQMACDGTQALTASPGADEADCYTWSLSGGGSLSATTGKSVVYTAPSSNANCANNPTITLTNKSGATATLKIAVNCYTGSETAYKNNFCSLIVDWTCTPPPCGCPANLTCENVHMLMYEHPYSCSGSSAGGDDFAVNCETFCNYQNQCIFPPCTRAACEGASGTNAACDGIFHSKCDPARPAGPWDQRTTAMKTAGCCPAALL